MLCPIDQTELVMTERQNVEIDYCPKCRGIWLDRGELDKIIERSAPVAAAAPASVTNEHLDRVAPPAEYYPPQKHRESDEGYRHGHDSRYQKKHKREGFLGDLFDF